MNSVLTFGLITMDHFTFGHSNGFNYFFVFHFRAQLEPRADALDVTDWFICLSKQFDELKSNLIDLNALYFLDPIL